MFLKRFQTAFLPIANLGVMGTKLSSSSSGSQSVAPVCTKPARSLARTVLLFTCPLPEPAICSDPGAIGGLVHRVLLHGEFRSADPARLSEGLSNRFLPHGTLRLCQTQRDFAKVFYTVFYSTGNYGMPNPAQFPEVLFNRVLLHGALRRAKPIKLRRALSLALTLAVGRFFF